MLSALMDAQSMGLLKVMVISSPSDNSPSAGSGVPKTCGAVRSMVPAETLEYTLFPHSPPQLVKAWSS